MWVYDPSALSFLSKCPGATPNERRASTTLPRTSPNQDAGKRQLVHSYSSAAPRAELLKHLAISQAPGNHPGSSAPSQIRNSLRLKNRRSNRTPSQSVTSLGGATRQLILVCLGPQTGIVSAQPDRSKRAGQGSAISAARREKHLLTLREMSLRISVTSPIGLTGLPLRAL